MLRSISLLLLFALGTISNAQVITPNESAIVVQSPKKIGINLNGPANYGAAEFYKNLIWQNPGFEPDLYRDKYVAFTNGTSTSFTAPSQYDPVVANFWTGASFSLYRGSPKAQICSGTIAGNTTATNTTGPTYTFSSACSSSVTTGDVIILRKAIACTPEADLESSHGGWPANISGGGQLTSDCSTPYDGVQSMRMDASVSGSTAGVTAYVDSAAWQTGILLNGQYTISGYYKTVGSPTFSVSAQRNSSGAGNPFTCATKTFAASPAWTAFSSVCTGNETNALPVSTVSVNFTAKNGVVELDDVAFQRTSGNDPTNTTVFRDELLATLKAHCAGGSLTAVPCELRDWAGQNADEIDNTIKPLFQRSPAVNSFNYDYAGGQGHPVISVSLEEFLELCQAIGAEPYYALPETTSPSDGPKWIEYLNGAASTPYGAKRSTNGQSASWLTVFPTIHLAMGNENWNVGSSGEGLGFRESAPDLYYDYSTDAAGVWGAMRSGSSWPSGGSGFDLILGFQTGNANFGVTEAMSRTAANSGELAPYTQAYVGDVSPLTALWNPLFYEAVANTTNSATIFNQQGNAIKNYGKLNVYEFDNGTSDGTSALTQSVLDSFTDAAGYGTATALQALQHLTFGVVDQNFFSLPQYYVPGPYGTVVHHWGAVIDMGGATNAVRPQELGMRMANAAIIGPMYDCTVAGPTTTNLGSNHNGYNSSGTPASSQIPQEYAYCFMAGTQRSMILINTDVVNSRPVSFSGSGAPSGNVAVTRYAPSSISATNEASGTTPTNTATQNVATSAPFILSYPSGDTLPPYSITRYDWVKGSGGSSTATTTTIAVSNNAPAPNATVVLTASVTSSSATGWVTFLDGTTTLGSVMLSSGTSSFTLNNIGVGSHSFTASYGGSARFAGSTSSAMQLFVAGPYIHTTFNEYGSGKALNGTAPATDVKGSTWTDPNIDWFFGSGGVAANGPDLTNPTLIDATQANYVATYTYPANGAQLLFRYVDLNNYVYVLTYPGEIDLYSRVNGTNTTLGTIYPSNTAAQLTVTLNGSTATILCGGQTASGTIPSSLLSGTTLGFFPRSSGFVISSLDVSPIAGATNSTTATSTTLAASNTAPAAGTSITLTACVSPSAAAGTVSFFDGSTALGSATLSAAGATYTVNSITAGSHNFTAVYSGSATYATSTSSAISVVASNAAATATTTSVSSSNMAPVAGTSITLTAGVSPSAAAGMVTLSEGGTVVGTGTLASSTTSFTISSITAGTHTYTASYGGTSAYTASTSSPLVVTASSSSTPPSSSAYIHTTFNEFASGHALNKTSPAVNTVNATWTDPNIDWFFGSGGVAANGPDLTNPTLIDATQANYVATYTYPANGAQLLFRYVDLNNYVYVLTYPGEIDLYSRVNGTNTTLGTIYPNNTAAQLTVTLNGSAATILCGGQTASGTIPSSLLSGTTLGFFPRSSGFVISSLDVSPIAGAASSTTATTTTLAASNTAPAAGTSITLTAGVSPSAAAGMVTLTEGGTVVGTGTLASSTTSFTISSITAGTHTYTASYGGTSAYTASTSSPLVVTASSSSTPPSSSAYIHTTFNEFASGHALNKTSPAVNTVNATWTDPNIDWFFGSGGVAANGPDLTNPTLIDATQANYVATYTYPANGAQLLFRYVDLNNYVYVLTYPGEIDLYSRVNGTNTTLGTIYPNNTAAQLTVTLNGSAATILCGGQTASGTIPSSLLSGTTLGFFPRSSGFVISSLDVSPIAGATNSTTATSTTLAASNTAPAAGTSITLTAGVSPSAAAGMVSFFDGSTALGSATLSSASATYTVNSISAGSHSFTAVYSGNASYATSTSSVVAATASSSTGASGAYLHTTFNEASASAKLAGTAPAIDTVGSKWTDPNGDWTYVSGGGISAAGPDVVNPTLIDVTHSNYTASFTYPASGAHLLFRYIDVNNYVFVYTYPGEIDLYSEVAGKRTTLATIYPNNTAAALTVKLNGATGTISCGGQTASGTIPSSLLSGTAVGFFPRSAGFVVSSLDVSP